MLEDSSEFHITECTVISQLCLRLCALVEMVEDVNHHVLYIKVSGLQCNKGTVLFNIPNSYIYSIIKPGELLSSLYTCVVNDVAGTSHAVYCRVLFDALV